jgi:hypothetical protein
VAAPILQKSLLEKGLLDTSSLFHELRRDGHFHQVGIPIFRSRMPISIHSVAGCRSFSVAIFTAAISSRANAAKGRHGMMRMICAVSARC